MHRTRKIIAAIITLAAPAALAAALVTAPAAPATGPAAPCFCAPARTLADGSGGQTPDMKYHS